jgi:MFS family permease
LDLDNIAISGRFVLIFFFWLVRNSISLHGSTGSFGASPLTNAAGVVTDIFPAEKRGIGMAIFSAGRYWSFIQTNSQVCQKEKQG